MRSIRNQSSAAEGFQIAMRFQVAWSTEALLVVPGCRRAQQAKKCRLWLCRRVQHPGEGFPLFLGEQELSLLSQNFLSMLESLVQEKGRA